MIKKLRERKGESVAETLYSTLIISLAFLILAGAIISAASINAKVKNQDRSLDMNYENGVGSLTVKVKNVDLSKEKNVSITGYYSGHGYYYYK